MNKTQRVIAAVQAAAPAALAVALENLNGAVVLVGAVWLYVGVRGFSPHAADVVAGAALLAIGVWPYVQRTRRP